MPHRGFGCAGLGNPHKVILRTKEESSVALRTHTDDQDAVKAGILGSHPLDNLLTEQDGAGLGEVAPHICGRYRSSLLVDARDHRQFQGLCTHSTKGSFGVIRNTLRVIWT